MNSPEYKSPFDALERQLGQLQNQVESPTLLVATIRLHDALVAAYQTADNSEKMRAAELYNQIVEFSGRICETLNSPEHVLLQQGETQERIAQRSTRRQAIRAENERREQLAGTGSTRHRRTPQTVVRQERIRERKAQSDRADYVRPTRSYGSTGKRMTV